MRNVFNSYLVIFCIALMAFTDAQAQKLKVGIVSIGKPNPTYIAVIKKSLESYYHAKVKASTIQIPIDSSLLSIPPAHLRAKSTIALQVLNTESTNLKLSQLRLRQYDIIIGITDSAITVGHLSWMTYNTPNRDLYLMRGLAESDLKVVTISTYKLKKQAKDEQEFIADLGKVARHETAHVLGVQHCDSEHCLMLSAPRFKTASNTFCQSCLEKIDKKYLKKKKQVLIE